MQSIGAVYHQFGANLLRRLRIGRADLEARAKLWAEEPLQYVSLPTRRVNSIAKWENALDDNQSNLHYTCLIWRDGATSTGRNKNVLAVCRAGSIRAASMLPSDGLYTVIAPALPCRNHGIFNMEIARRPGVQDALFFFVWFDKLEHCTLEPDQAHILTTLPIMKAVFNSSFEDPERLSLPSHFLSEIAWDFYTS